MPKLLRLTKFYLLSFTWGLPWTLIGLIVFGISWVYFHEDMKIRLIEGRIAVTFTKQRFGGVSLGIVYFVDRSDSERLHNHELGHTIQSMYWGSLFIFVIAIPSFLRYHYRAHLRKTNLEKWRSLPHYDSVWFEGQATELGNKHFGKLVKEMVRAGK